jgi:peptide/nickel transport system permease protein
MAQDMDRKLTDKEKQDLEKVLPMWRIVLNQFMEHRMAVVGLSVILLFVTIALMAPFIRNITGLDPDAQNPLNRYKPPMSLVEMSADKKEDKVIRFESENSETVVQLRKDVMAQGTVTAEAEEDALYELVKLPKEEIEKTLNAIGSPQANAFLALTETFFTKHILGTDELGRDVLVRLVYGTRVSMGVGIMVALFSAFVGLLIGSVAGFYGGWIDMVLMRVTDALLSLPILPFLIVVAAIDLNKIPFFNGVVGSENESIVKMVVILLLFSWMTIALLVRGSILSLREREFILAARTLGAKDSTIIFRHMFPNVIAPMLVSVTLGVGNAILFESALSFLGLGIQPPMASWGNMLFNAQELISEAPFLAVVPGLLILFTVISFNYLGDGLQDAIDPKALRR